MSAANFVVGLGAFVIIGILNPVADAFQITTAQAGGLMVVYSVAYTILSPLIVSATGHMGRRRVLAIGMSLFAIAALVSALAQTATVLFTARVLAAAGAGMITPVAAAVAAGLSPPEKQGAALSLVFLGFSLSQVVGVPLGSYLAYTFGWRTAFALVVLLAVPSIWLIWVLVPKGLRFAPVGLADLGAALRTPKLMLSVLFTTVFLTGSYVILTYIAPLLAETMNFGRDGITLTLTLSGLGAVAGSLLGGVMTDKLGSSATLTILCVMQILIMPFYSTLPMPAVWLFFLSAMWAAFGWAFMPAQQVRLISLQPSLANVLLALNAGAVYLGAAAVSAIGGAVLNSYGLLALGITGSLCVVVALILLHIADRMGAS